MRPDWIDWMLMIGVSLCFGLAFLLMALMSGCATSAPTPTNSDGIISKTASSTDWLMTIFILGSAGCVFAGLNGLKMGWLGLGACLFGLVLKMALSVTWGYYVACILLLCGVGCAVYSVVWKNKVVTELVTGTQRVKELFLSDKKDDVNAVLKAAQEKTQTYVAAVKNKLYPEDK